MGTNNIIKTTVKGRILFLLMILMLSNGCSTTDYYIKEDEEYQEHIEERQLLKQYLDDKVGKWSVDDALVTLGPNPHIVNGDTVIIYTWNFYNSQFDIVNIGAPGPYCPFPITRTTNRTYQLTFDKDTRILIHYKFNIDRKNI